MIMHDINPEKEKVMLLIHPMMSSAEGMQECITDYMGDGYRYLIPDLNGHGDAVTKTYVSAKDEASAIHTYLTEHGIERIQLGFCASLGGCVLFELLEYRDICFDHLFFEGVSFYEHTKLLFFLSKKMFLGKHKKAVADPRRAERIMAKLYGEEAACPMTERFIKINETSIINICHDCSYVHLPEMDEELQKKCIFAYGENDFDLKNTRKVLPGRYPYAELKVWEGRGHCERISKDSAAYAKMLEGYML